MSKEDTAQGLLSKMVKFVRNPATSWSELDSKETDRDEAISKLHLKEMIERKRRNDFVRKREFDMLRKMRKRESIVGQDPAARPSFFQSSMPSKPDDRAKTLKKIDEIEAQMSMQWWKTKHGQGAGDSSSLQPGDSSLNFPSVPNSARPSRRPPAHLLDNALPTSPAAYGTTEPVGLQPLASSRSVSQVPSGTPYSAGQSSLPPQLATPPIQQALDAKRKLSEATPAAKPSIPNRLAGGNYEAGASGFTATNMMAMEVLEVAHDAELEEASIRYANGDDAGAEAGLLEMLASGSMRAAQPEIWMVLFDLYRATGQQDPFETAAIKFVQRFDRSAPQWFSLPDAVQQMVAPAVAAGNGPSADWICPSSVGIQTVAALKAALAKAPMPWRLDWSNLKTIEPAAVEAVCNVFAGWSAQPVQLRFMGDGQLQQVLQKNTPSGIRDTPQDWWQLRMEALRVTHRPDEFELAALDFCVTYEVSPPAWGNARCDYKHIDQQGMSLVTHTIIGDVFRDSLPSGVSVLEGDSALGPLNSQMGRLMSVELSGQIEGDAAAMLEVLQAKLLGADNMVISCAKLIRVDFSAAGTLLNWVSARQEEGRMVHFCDVNRLVAAFFNVIGITEHAQVTSRRD